MYRAVYRTIELSDGWGGVIISTERYFSESSTILLLTGYALSNVLVVLDAIMIVLGMYVLNVIHPWYFLYRDAARQVY